ncbi:MAG TPA: hypothetical protein VGL53_11285 [Bryobacteraceae bacterium]|jgi:hypothetical protein
MITLIVEEQISFSSRSTGTSLVQSSKQQLSGLSTLETTLPALENQAVRAQTAASSDAASLTINLSGGANSPGDLASSLASATAALEDSITITSAATGPATQVTGIEVTGSGQNSGAYSFTCNGQTSTVTIPPGSPLPVSATVETPLDLASRVLPLSLNITDQMLFGNGDGGARLTRVKVKGITIRVPNGTNLDGFTYSTTSGNSYNIFGGTYAPQTRSAT